MGRSSAHEWYTDLIDPVFKYRCCNGQDCQQYPAEWVTVKSDGYHLKSGETIAFRRVIPSWDEHYHRCVQQGGFEDLPAESTRCFVAPSGGL
jgi:hypothetical protein